MSYGLRTMNYEPPPIIIHYLAPALNWNRVWRISAENRDGLLESGK